MGIFSMAGTYGRSRLMTGLLRRIVGGRIATGLTLFYFGKKAYNHMRARRASKVRYS